MALISSKPMCLEPILKLNCKILMRFSAATVVRTIPICALDSFPIHTIARIKPDFVPASLFSTDSKRPKKTTQGDKSISKHVNHPFEKRKENHIQTNMINSFLRELKRWATITQRLGNPWP